MGLTLAGATALSAGIGAVGSLFGTHQQGQYNAKEAQKDRDFQERMYNQQVQDNINFWKMSNEYDLPSAQLARLQEAGLNPLLAYGQGGNVQNVASGTPQSAQAPSGAQASRSFNNPLDLANLALLQAQVENIKADSELKRTEAGKVGSETQNLEFDLAYKRDVRDIRVAQESAQFDLTKSMEALNREQRYFYRDQCKVLGAQVESILSDMENKKAMTAAQIKDINTRLDKFLEQFPHVIANLDSQTRKNYADALAATVAARYQQELLDSGYINILAGKEGQDFLNAIKYGTGLDIENGLKALEFQSRPEAGSWMYRARNFMEYVGKPAVEILEDAAIGAGGLYMLKGGFGKMGKIGFKP